MGKGPHQPVEKWKQAEGRQWASVRSDPRTPSWLAGGFARSLLASAACVGQWTAIRPPAQPWPSDGASEGAFGPHVQGDVCGFSGETSEEKFAVTSHEWP